MQADKRSRIGFVVVKLCFGGVSFYLMRRNDKWKDYNFIGGHENERDLGSLQRAANREFREEVPASRSIKYELRQLTRELNFGPLYSRSAQATVLYTVQFFLLLTSSDPTAMLNNISIRSKNRLVPEADLVIQGPRITRFATLLGKEIGGGMEGIPLSWPEELPSVSQYSGLFNTNQLDLSFR